MNGGAFDIVRAVQRSQHFRHSHGHALRFRVPAVRRSRRDLPHKGRRGHLPACHAVDRVVDEDCRNFFPAGRGMYDFRRTDGSEVAIPLVGEHQVVRARPLDPRCNRRRAPVRRLHHIAVEIIVRKHRAADRRNADRLILHSHFLDAFRDQPVNDAVRASGAIMEGHVCQHFCFFKYFCHLICPPSILKAL